MTRSNHSYAHGLRLAFVVLMAACEGSQGPAGTNGEPGANALAETSAEPPGANCPDGGQKIEVGIDTNGNGALDAGEVTTTSYVCNGAGTDSLVRTGSEPAGANCPWGGTRIETGLDADGDGTLDDNEVNASETSYVCNFGPSGALSPSTGINIAVRTNGVSTQAGAPITVRFTMRDDRGYPLDIAGNYSVNTPIQPRFAIGYYTKDGAGIVSPLTVFTKSASASAPNGQPTSYNPASAGQGTLVENGLGAGDYTYTFPTTSTTNGPFAVAYDTAHMGETHVVWVQASRQTDLVYQLNANTFAAGDRKSVV